MADNRKHSFNEAEQFLLKYWQPSLLLVSTMDRTRQKCEAILHHAVESARSRHEVLTAGKVKKQGKWFALGKKEWQTSRNLIGFYFDNLSVDNLTDDDGGQPCAYIWIYPATELGVDLAQARRTLEESAATLLEKDEQARIKPGKDSGTALITYFQEDRLELVEQLQRQNGDPFIETLMAYVDLFVKFTPAIDAIIASAKSAKRGAKIEP